MRKKCRKLLKKMKSDGMKEKELDLDLNFDIDKYLDINDYSAINIQKLAQKIKSNDIKFTRVIFGR